jgi:prepilin-type N-terminal cleavage/methylation domain-containing protein
MARSRRATGFSLIEMLTVMALFATITTVVALIFNRGTFLYRHGEAHIEMQRMGRHLVSRLTPYIASVFDADNPSATPLRSPAFASDSSPELIFNTTEDWFAPDYPSPTTSARLVASIGDLQRFTYRVRRVNSAGDPNDGNVVIERINGDGSAPPYVVTIPVIDNTRVLLRPKAGESIPCCPINNPNTPCPSPAAEHARHFKFTWANDRKNGFYLTFTARTTARSDAGQPIEINEDFRITFNLPK